MVKHLGNSWGAFQSSNLSLYELENIIGEIHNLKFKAGCSLDSDVSHFALDALRQLSMKFLEKGELPNFRFQKEFLHPFEGLSVCNYYIHTISCSVIMGRNKTLECQEMIIACITNMVHSHASRFRSGWKNVFSVLGLAASEKDKKIVEQAFSTTTEIICISSLFVLLLLSFIFR